MDQACEHLIKVALGARVQDMRLQAEGAGRRLQVSCIGLGKNGIGRVDEERNNARRGDQLMQQFQSLRRHLLVQLSDAGDVAARPDEARD